MVGVKKMILPVRGEPELCGGARIIDTEGGSAGNSDWSAVKTVVVRAVRATVARVVRRGLLVLDQPQVVQTLLHASLRVLLPCPVQTFQRIAASGRYRHRVLPQVWPRQGLVAVPGHQPYSTRAQFGL